MSSIISISKLTKTYESGLRALISVDLDIRQGEIFALRGPNGAGKTTLISIFCGIVTPTSGAVRVDGHDIVHDYRARGGRGDAADAADQGGLASAVGAQRREDLALADVELG